MANIPDTAVLVIIGVLLLVAIILTFRLWALERKLKIFFRGKEARSLEEILILLRNEVADSSSALEALEVHLKNMESRLQKTTQHVGIIRFNPFKDSGGDQSFSIALLDEAHSGVVISSLYSRDGVRVYAKPVEAGNSRYQLSEEERKAIQKAVEH